MVQPLPFLELEGDDHFGHSEQLSMQQHEEFRGKLDSILHVSSVCNDQRLKRIYLIVGNKVVSAHPLNLRRAEHPADIINYFNIRRSCLRIEFSVSEIYYLTIDSPSSTAVASLPASGVQAARFPRAYYVICTIPRFA